MKTKVPVCEKCGATLKGRVPVEVKVICYFCSNPLYEGDDATNQQDNKGVK